MLDYFDDVAITKAINFAELIHALQQAFAQRQITAPVRHHHCYRIEAETPSTLLLMPAWEKENLGVKMVTVSPDNAQVGLASVQGVYVLFDGQNGQPKALLAAKSLTNIRTAAASALASSLLSRTDSRCLLMVGTGALAPMLIQAHACVRPLERVIICGRSMAKAEAVKAMLGTPDYDVECTVECNRHIVQADIISCATLSKEPLIFGQWLVSGQHLDLVGAFRPDMREADNDCLLKSRIFIDHSGALQEAGELFIPIQAGIITPEDVCGDLASLCRTGAGRNSNDDITLFKSVGHALEDLVAAKCVLKNARVC